MRIADVIPSAATTAATAMSGHGVCEACTPLQRKTDDRQGDGVIGRIAQKVERIGAQAYRTRYIIVHAELFFRFSWRTLLNSVSDGHVNSRFSFLVDRMDNEGSLLGARHARRARRHIRQSNSLDCRAFG